MKKNTRRPHRAKGLGPVGSSPSRRRRGWRMLGYVLLALVVLLCTLRIALPFAVRDYVNRTLDRDPLYSGTIGPIRVHLLRGAYSIHGVRISKSNGNVPVPLLSAARIDFSLEWKALLHRRVVGRFVMEQPELNFVAAPTAEESQTGAGGPWLEMIRDLFPFTINSARIHDGSVHFRTFEGKQPVDVYLSHLEASVDDLSNIQSQTEPLVARIEATALAMDQAKLEYRMRMDPFSYRPSFHLAVRLLGLDATRLNDLAEAYGKFNFKRGWFDLVMETDAKDGQLTGYIKPLFRDLQVFSLTQDIKEDNVLRFFWQALVGGATSLLKNTPRNQFGTLIPFSGDASGAKTADILATLGNLLRNAFVRAYLPRLENTGETVEGVEFGVPELVEEFSATDEAQ